MFPSISLVWVTFAAFQNEKGQWLTVLLFCRPADSPQMLKKCWIICILTDPKFKCLHLLVMIYLINL